MNIDGTIEIAAPAATVWTVFADVEHWHEWTASIDSIVPLDGPGLAVGHRFEIKQPRYPKIVWEVTDVEPGVSWTWRHRSAGTDAVARHEVIDLGGERTRVRQHIEQRGPVGAVVGALTRRRAEHYVSLEAEGLKARSEQRHRDASTA